MKNLLTVLPLTMVGSEDFSITLSVANQGLTSKKKDANLWLHRQPLQGNKTIVTYGQLS